MPAFGGDYYAQCQIVFRRATNQPELMLAVLREYCQGKERLGILSVGSGTGLFELPMLKMFAEHGVIISKFVGIDIDGHACDNFRITLQEDFGSGLNFDIQETSFQDFNSPDHFDLILYNHVFEYLQADHLRWIRKSQKLVTNVGNILIFSPNIDSINKIYEAAQVFYPFFSNDLSNLLDANSIDYSTKLIVADCDISLLQEPDNNQEKVMLLSFLTQFDCRKVSAEKMIEYSDYFLSLRQDGKNGIPHPTTLFVL